MPRLLAFRFTVLFWGGFFLPQGIFSQITAKEDSLLNLVSQAPNDTTRVNLYNELFRASVNVNLGRAVSYEKEGLAIAQRIQWRKGILLCTYNLGAGYAHLGTLDSAETYNLMALKLYQEQKNKLGIARCLNNLGSVNYNRGKFSIARTQYKEAMDLFKEVKDSANVIGCLNNIGSCYQEQSNYPTALEYYIQAIENCEQIRDEESMAMPLGNAGYIYLRQEQDSLANICFKRAMAIYEKYDKRGGRVQILRHFGYAWLERKDLARARQFYEEALDLCVKAGDELGEATTLLALSSLDHTAGHTEKVLPTLLQVLNTFKNKGVKKSEAEASLTIGKFLIEEKKPRESIPYLTAALDTCRVLGALDMMADAHKQLASAWASLGDFQTAYANMSQYVLMNDSLFSVEKSAQISDILSRYESQKQDKKMNELKLINTENELQLAQGRVYLIFLVSVLALAVLMAILFFFLFRQRNRSSREIARKNHEIQAQRDLVEQQNQRILEINTGLEKIVAERTRTLMELNHELDAFLYESAHALRRPITSVQGLMNLLGQEKTEQGIESLRRNIFFTLSRMDNMLHKLIMVNENNRKPVDSSPVFIETLVEEAMLGVAREGAQLEVNARQEAPVMGDPFRLRVILQNLLENAFHFRSSEPGRVHQVKVDSQVKNGSLIVKVSDNGIGIAPDLRSRIFEMFLRGTERSPGNGLGLYVVKKMCDKLGASLQVESVEGQFSRFILTVPLKK